MVKFLRRKSDGQAFKVKDKGDKSGLSGLTSTKEQESRTKINKKLPRLLRKPQEIANRKFDEVKRERAIKSLEAKRDLAILQRRAELENNEAKIRRLQATQNLLLAKEGLPEQKLDKTVNELRKEVKSLPSEPVIKDSPRIITPITPEKEKGKTVSTGIFSSKSKSTLPMEGSLPAGSRSSDQPTTPSSAGVNRSPFNTTPINDVAKEMDKTKQDIDKTNANVEKLAKEAEEKMKKEKQTMDKAEKKKQKKLEKELKEEQKKQERLIKEQARLEKRADRELKVQELKDEKEIKRTAEREEKALLEEIAKNTKKAKKDESKEAFLAKRREEEERRKAIVRGEAVANASFDFG